MRTETPRISVVVASVSGLECVVQCLEALERQLQPALTEILVVDRCGAATREALRTRFPFAQVLAAEQPALRDMRAQGLARASGSLVAVLADRFVAEDGWLAALVCEGQSGRPIVGGSIDPDMTANRIDWAVFFCEYARFMPPLPGGPTSNLPGNNVAYSRPVLERLAETAARGYWDTTLHTKLSGDGLSLWLATGMRVTLRRRHRWRAALLQRYLAGRAFAAARVAGEPWRRCLGYALATPLLPVLLLGRIVGCVARRRRYRLELVLASPLVLFLLWAGACGESVGALCGAGNSLERLD